MGKFLTSEQRKELLAELKIERARKYADRIRVILLLDDSETYKDISKFLFLDEGTIANYRKRFKNGGIEELINDYYTGKRSALSETEQNILINDLQLKIFSTTKSVITHIKNKFGIQYSRGGATELLHRLGFSFKKATPVPGKANRKKQQQFINQYNGIKPHGIVYFGDSTHPEFAPTISYGWIKKGKNFEVKTNSGWRKRVNITGAIEINSLDVIVRSSKAINKDSICEILRAIRRKNLNEEKIYFVLDGAAYNRSEKVKFLAKKLGIRIFYLPPYSPNLNPIERLWKFMKKKVTANRYFEEFDEFKKTLMEFFRGIRKYRSELETLITDNFSLIGT
jgi:transposase